MGRRPEVFVRQVSMAEGQRLQRITRTDVHRSRVCVPAVAGRALPQPHRHRVYGAIAQVDPAQPIFDVNCVKCHGPLDQKSGLELDTAQAALKGSEDGPVIVPGKPEESASPGNDTRSSSPRSREANRGSPVRCRWPRLHKRARSSAARPA